MDMRTGELYESKEAAKALGVPEANLQQIGLDADIITVLTGPFKGRRYERVGNKRGRRVFPDAPKEPAHAD